jgi:hypothetical protein
VVTAREGETLEHRYRVEAIGRDDVTLLYLPLGVRQTLPMNSSLIMDKFPAATAAAPEATSPAQLRWAGPAQVKAGDAFSVALKLSAAQAVGAVPLELSYDAALLEALDVRPGESFANGLFSYRINSEGSIFVGASGKDGVASDAEVVIVTFKPLRAGATAEVKVSSTIVEDQPAAFRTAILR